MSTRTPVILDTDIGTDIDDTWALVQLLKSPALDLKLLTSCSGDTEYRARLAARLLQIAGRSDVPVGVGVAGEPLKVQPQGAFVEGYALDDYPGEIRRDGVGALIETVLASASPVTILSIGPMTNLAEALHREPRIAERARVVGMQGSVRLGYRGSSEIAPEYNVLCDVDACRSVLAAQWPVTLTPLDSCGLVYLKDELYQRVRACSDPLLDALFENYRVWLEAVGAKPERLEQKSTTLYDTVAVYLAESEELLQIEELGLRVDAEGYTRIDADARPLRVATGWKDRGRFLRLLVERLTSQGSGGRSSA